MRRYFLVSLVVIGACTTSKVTQIQPSAAPAAVTAAFMQAVADSNLPQMGQLWGTSKGPAAVVNAPANWAQRIAVIHSYLKGGSSKVIGEGDASTRKSNRRQILVELNRNGCVKTVPFDLVLTKQGSWLVHSIDLNAAGIPGKPCPPPTDNPK